MASLEFVEPIAITGVGVITPLGDSLRGLTAALIEGQTCVTAEVGAAHPRALLSDFDPRRYANVRGMRVYARNTQLQLCAAQLALATAGLTPDNLDPLQLGVISASTFGHLETLVTYDQSLVSAGVARTNPTLMPLALPSAPGALTALSFGAKAFAITLSDGDATGLAALGLGARLLRAGRARACIVTGAFTHCAELTLSAAAAGMLAPVDGFRVFDRASRGTAFGELAIALVLERVETAEARNQPRLAALLGQASTFEADPTRADRGLLRACERALSEAGMAPNQIALVSASANGEPARDGAEARALLGLLGGRASQTPTTAPKSNLGEALDASGLVQTVVALEALRTASAPPIVGLQQPAVAGLHYLSQPGPLTPGCALVTSLAHSGACSALVVSAQP